MRLLSQMHSSFRGVSGSLSARSSSSFYLLAPPVPLHLFLSLSLVRLSRLLPNSRPSTLHNTRKHRRSAHSRSHPSSTSFSTLFLHFPSRLQRGSDSCSFLVFASSSLLSSTFFFLHHHIVARPFSGSGTNGRISGPPCKVGSPCFFITLVTGVVTHFGTPSFRT